MDSKLARGLTREGFRRDLRNLDAIHDSLIEVNRPFLEKLFSPNKIKRADVESALLSAARFKSDPHHTLFMEQFIHPKVRPLSKDFEGAIVGGNFSSRPLALFDHEEMTRSYSLFYDRYSRRGWENRLTERPIYIREHAISRLLERLGSDFKSVTMTLWPGMLIIEALEHFLPRAIARPFMLPTEYGAFLGLSAIARPPAYIKGTERTIINASGFNETVDDREADEIQDIWFVSTFVPISDLTDFQEQLRVNILNAIDRHRSILMIAHLGRIMSFAGEYDDLGLERRFHGDFESARSDFAALFSSELWLQGIRIPKDSPFANHFVAQEDLDKMRLAASS